MNHRFSKYLKSITFLSDLLAINGVWVTLYVTGHFVVSHEIYEKSWPYFLCIVNLSWVIITFYANPYSTTRIYRLVELVKDVFNSVFQHFLVTGTAIYMFDFRPIHKWGLPLVYIALLIIIMISRVIQFYLLAYYRQKGMNYRTVIIVGYGALTKHLKIFFEMHPEYGYKLCGYFDDKHDKPGVIGKLHDLEGYLKQNTIDEVYCCLPYIKYGEIKRIIDLSDDLFVKVKVITDFRAFSSKGLGLERYDHIPVLNVSSIPLDDKRNQAVKRTFDIIFATLSFFLVFSWLFPIIALAIKLDGKGPIFFTQKRTGKDNSDFYCWKFRTMRLNIEADEKQATKHDTRITRVGCFLRKYSLDELPQFINVVFGNMSIVGPRPHMLKHTEQYSQVIGKFMARHSVKPGITGLAQSMGYRGETRNVSDMRNRVRLDRFYIENWSFILDLKIILQTISSLIKKSENAY